MRTYLAEDQAELSRKVRKALQILLLPKPKAPGAKGWELRRYIGRDYPKVIEALNSELSRLDLEVRSVAEESDETIGSEEMDRAKFFIVMKSHPTSPELLSSGYRVDDLAALAATIAYITASQGKAPRKDVQELLREKFPKWKAELNLERFIRRGYLGEREGTLFIGWRTRAEVDRKTLLNLILSSPTPHEGTSQ